MPTVPISIRIGRAVLDRSKARGPRYQTRMNAVLRSYAATHGAGKERPAVKRGRR